MPLVYAQAIERRKRIAENKLLEELEISGFAKCIARGKCKNTDDLEYVNETMDSVKKQFSDLEGAFNSEDAVSTLEAIADLRNSAGLLFIAVQNAAEEEEQQQ